MRIIMSLALVLCVFTAVHMYIGARLVSLQVLPRSAAFPILAGLAVAMLGALFLARTGSGALPVRAVVWVGYSWMGMVLLLLIACLAGDLISLTFWVGQKLSFPIQPNTSLRISQFLLGAGALAGVWAMVQAMRSPEVHEVEVRVPNLPRSFEGYRLAHITDTHLSVLLRRAWSLNLVASVNAAHPDLVVHTGDIADGPVAALGPSIEPFAHLEAPRLFVTGNHEAYSGLGEWSMEMQRLGFTLLNNSHTVIERGGEKLVIGGIPDHNQANHIPTDLIDARKTFAGAPEGPRILLAHQPRSAFLVQGQSISLQLSGHTHGGQIWPFHYLVRLQQPMNAGFATVGDVPVFTSRGAGFWGPPLRLFARSEVPILVLRRG
ncbi:MAG: hypothetical protein RL318_20 [Fibrobacterota bacterium]|jgi:predicted MPP superfamily phosphohydrolase